jgi:beta-N-acetylhexosaminidase
VKTPLLAVLLGASLLSPAAAEQESLADAAARLILVGVRGTEVVEGGEFERAVCGLKVGGILLFDKDTVAGGSVRNVTDPEQLTRLTSDLQDLAERCGDGTLLIAADVEGGVVNRLRPLPGLGKIPRHLSLGRGSTRRTYRAAKKIGQQMSRAGLNWNLAPVVDVNLNPQSPAIGRWGRSFSSDAKVVTRHARAFIDGLDRGGVLNCIKHFPGHGSSTVDSHLGAVDVSETADLPNELAPYRKLIDDGVVDCVMPGHLYNKNIDPKRMATFSSSTLRGLLRDELGFEGLILTDDLQMHAVTKRRSLEKAAVLAIWAGADMLTVSNNRNRYDEELPKNLQLALVDAVLRGDISEERLREASARVLAFKDRLKR